MLCMVHEHLANTLTTMNQNFWNKWDGALRATVWLTVLNMKKSYGWHGDVKFVVPCSRTSDGCWNTHGGTCKHSPQISVGLENIQTDMKMPVKLFLAKCAGYIEQLLTDPKNCIGSLKILLWHPVHWNRLTDGQPKKTTSGYSWHQCGGIKMFSIQF